MVVEFYMLRPTTLDNINRPNLALDGSPPFNVGSKPGKNETSLKQTNLGGASVPITWEEARVA